MANHIRKNIEDNITKLEELLEYLLSSRIGDVIESSFVVGELILTTEPKYLQEVLEFLCDDRNTKFTQLVDLCGVDYPNKYPDRFEVVYNLLSVEYNIRIRVKIRANDKYPVPSIIDIFPTAGWFEREAWDMYGVKFSGNPDLRRLLTDYGFDGHPLRKDFPLTGFVEVNYDEERRKVVYNDVSLSQDYRYFDYESPWEGMDRNLPDYSSAQLLPNELKGDEKAS